MDEWRKWKQKWIYLGGEAGKSSFFFQCKKKVLILKKRNNFWGGNEYPLNKDFLEKNAQTPPSNKFQVFYQMEMKKRKFECFPAKEYNRIFYYNFGKFSNIYYIQEKVRLVRKPPIQKEKAAQRRLTTHTAPTTTYIRAQFGNLWS